MLRVSSIVIILVKCTLLRDQEEQSTRWLCEFDEFVEEGV